MASRADCYHILLTKMLLFDPRYNVVILHERRTTIDTSKPALLSQLTNY